MMIYELNVQMDESSVDECGEWLCGHVNSMMDVPGFEDAEILEQLDVHEAKAAFSVRFFVDSEEALENYLEKDAARVQSEIEKKFGGRIQISSRILVSIEEDESEDEE